MKIKVKTWCHLLNLRSEFTHSVTMALHEFIITNRLLKQYFRCNLTNLCEACFDLLSVYDASSTTIASESAMQKIYWTIKCFKYLKQTLNGYGHFENQACNRIIACVHTLLGLKFLKSANTRLNRRITR